MYEARCRRCFNQVYRNRISRVRASQAGYTCKNLALLVAQNAEQRACKYIRLRLLRHAARVQHSFVTLQRLIELLKIAAEHIRSEDHLLKSAHLRFGRVWARHAGPPEDGFEKLWIFLFLDQSRPGEVKKQIRIPASNLAGPGIIRIAQIGGR